MDWSVLKGLTKSISFGNSHAVGLSIGTSSIKLVEIKKVRKQWKLVHFGIIQLPEDAIVNREIVNGVAVVDAIKTLVNQLKLKTKQVCSSLSGASLIIKRMSLEIQNMKELQEQVFWEAEQYLPFDVSEVVMDFQLLQKTEESHVDVLLVAVKRLVLESYMSCIKDAGLKPKVMDVDFFALDHLYGASYPATPDAAAAVVDIGASAIKIVIIHNSIPVFTKDVVMGGRNLTAEIQKNLNLSYADAEMLKIGGSNGEIPQEVIEIMTIISENFAGEIKRALDFYNVSSLGAPVSAVYLAGGSSRIPNLTRVVEETTGVPTQMMNPFNSISYDPAVFTQEYIDTIAPIAAIPIGLAIRAGVE